MMDFVNCFWCHDVDSRLGVDGTKAQGSYGNSYHVDGETHFILGNVSQGSTGENSLVRMATGGHCSNKSYWGD